LVDAGARVVVGRFGSSAWKYHNMFGYTSVGAGSSIVAVRINCLPESRFIISSAAKW
jgi:hypothetical protein